MSSKKQVQKPNKEIKRVRLLKKLLITLEIIFGIFVILYGIVRFVPSVKTAVIGEMAKTGIGRTIIGWFGSESYDKSVFDASFDNNKISTNELKYNYSEEYTSFVMFGVDSREGEVDASNSDSILIVSIHNTTGEVKFVSVYRDTLLGIYSREGNLNNYFKVNSAYAGGGPEGAINTLNKNLDLDISDYVTVNFGGVARIIDTLGGIRVNLTDAEVKQLNHHMKSTISSTGQYAPPIKKAGYDIKLNGIQATTYCRIRKATFIDPDTGEEVRDDFGRAARQRSVMMKLVERAKKASGSELQDMVQAVFDKNSDKDQIISTSFTFDEIVNMIPIIFNFELSGSQGFPSDLTTGTLSGASYVIPKGLSANVSKLHEFLFGEKDYQPTENVNAVSNYVVGYTGIDEYSSGGYNEDYLGTSDKSDKENPTEDMADYDYDDNGDSEFY